MRSEFLARVPQQAPLTALPERLAWTAVMAAGVILLLLAVRRSWGRRSTRQEAAFALPAVPPSVGEPAVRAQGTYLGTVHDDGGPAPTRRYLAHRLAFPAEAELVAGPAGLLLHRAGGAPLFVAAGDVLGVRPEAGFAGRYVEREGVVVVHWRAGTSGTQLLSGFRPRSALEATPLLRAIQASVEGKGRTRPPATPSGKDCEPDCRASSK